MDNVYNWQFNCLPGSANQGAILMTRNDIIRPPFTQDDFIWVAMEDVIGTADIRLTYNEKTNIYTLEKAIGHRNNDGSWIKDWYVVGSWERLSQEVADILRQLVYVEYRYDTTEPNTLKVIGIRKDMTQDIICNINFVSAEVLAEAVITLENKITAETTRATNKEDEIAEDLSDEVTRATTRENELQEMIESATMNPGRAIEVTGEKVINVLIDNESIKTNNANQLKADVFDDTAISNTKGWSSAKISQELTGAMHYKGQVATYADLPTTGLSEGDLYNVVDTGDNYAWNGSSWDNMSGEYIAGAGIDITGKVISATGIAFQVGDGLQTSGTGSTTTLLTRNGNGLEYGPNRENKVKAGNGISVNSNGVNIITGNSTQIAGNRLEVKPHNGLITTTNGLNINANFTTKATPLGTENSKLALYSDGKIAVDFEESPVILTADLLGTYTYANGTNERNNVSIPELANYDMFYIAQVAGGRTPDSDGSEMFGQIIVSNSSASQDYMITQPYWDSGPTTGSPSGMRVYMLYISINWENNTVLKSRTWQTANFTGNWNNYSSNISGGTGYVGFRIYGIKAR